MAAGTRLSNVIIKMPDRSTVTVERRLLRRNGPLAEKTMQHVCTLASGEAVDWLGGGKYQLPDGRVGIAVAHRRATDAQD
ncbi:MULTISPECIES: hypothetical protein [Achromobacter]|jgi:hypothetical protein|uniref:hypothetical protein n=1 Tax=Achromobacter TaxID=222 RepID=UPI0012DA3B69|nr:hypothetical protein [Achromobacter dolens]